jgi:1-phosphofructokinase family hexose kinase
MRAYVLTITLNPAIDKSTLIPNFAIGKDFRAKVVFCSAGGKGINVARVLKALGIPTIASGILAGSSGQYIHQHLNHERISNDFCFIAGQTRTNVTIIDPHAGTATRVLEAGPWVSQGSLRAFLVKYRMLLTQSRLVVFSGSLSPGIPENFYATLISMARKQNIPAILDTSGIPLKLGVKARPFMVKPNLQEAQYLLGQRITPARIAGAVRTLYHNSGSDIVSITRGSLGAVIFDGNEMLQGIPEKIGHKNLVGCGDAFIAGFVASFLRHKPLQDSLRLAIACGTANMLELNPGFLKKRDIRKLLKKVRILPLRSVTPFYTSSRVKGSK